MKTLSETMMNVTETVFRAERSLDQARIDYEALMKAEQAIADHPDASAHDKDIALWGVQNARRILDGVRALLRLGEAEEDEALEGRGRPLV